MSIYRNEMALDQETICNLEGKLVVLNSYWFNELGLQLAFTEILQTNSRAMLIILNMERFTLTNLVLSFMLGAVMTAAILYTIMSTDPLFNNIQKQLDECEYALLRNKICKIIAVEDKQLNLRSTILKGYKL